jgi:serine phosphatase RsbU (regulator of sigma subunit)/anti-sigma regulatory factor (Ser/Thr protein kinase)
LKIKNRLFDVGLLINRILVYGILIGILALTYAASVTGLQTFFRALTGGSSQLAVVGSTLAIVALFAPLRRRIQDVIDRRLYPRQYSAAQALTAFSATVRDETDLDQLVIELLALVEETLQPERISLWLRTAMQTPVQERLRPTAVSEFEIAPDDPIIPHLHKSPGPLDASKLELDSPMLAALRETNAKLVVPLISQGELIGVINLGARLGEQGYSTHDRRVLNDMAAQAAPAVRVAQLVRQQKAEALARERLEQELRVARLIQETLLPKEVPELPGWELAVYWQPAQAVGGDFYDFLPLPDGRLVLIVADVTDKGVPAALVMATTRAILRGAARRLLSPGAALERSNELLHPEIPPNMFVTCLYAILDPTSGRLEYANAGHDLPYLRQHGHVAEMRATGMPLGLMPGMHYEEKAAIIAPGECILFYSDGLVEAHNPQREMFGFPHLRELVMSYSGNLDMIDYLLAELAKFTGPGWEQEDDVTLMSLRRLDSASSSPIVALPETAMESEDWQLLSEFSIASEPFNERLASETVDAAIRELKLSSQRRERLKTAVAEATMNAIEHGNHYQAHLPVLIRVLVSPKREGVLKVQITDHGGDQLIPDPQTPDLEAKLAGRQTPRGWGLFLIENMVDEMRVTTDAQHHTVELILSLQAVENVNNTA